MTALLLAAVAFQRTPAETQALRKYRYGLPAVRVEAMGLDGYQRFFEQKTPDGSTGPYRGVSYAVFIDAYRENTERQYRKPLSAATRARLVELDRQMRFLGVLFARNAWLFSPGNGYDPESDDLTYAEAERQLYTLKGGTPNPAQAQRRLAAYRTGIRKEARKEDLLPKTKAQIEANLVKIDGAVKKGLGYTRTAAERAVFYEFVTEQAKVPTL